MELLIPAFYFPTQKILINHDETLNQSILSHTDHHSLQVFKEPHLALDYLKNDYQPVFNSTDLFEIEDHTEYYDLTTPHPIRINTQKMREIIYNKQCHEDISVLIVNYPMNDRNDLKWLAPVHYPAIKRLLIIHDDAALAVAKKALQDGLIHAYLKQDDPEFSQKLAHTIQELAWRYFLELSHLILSTSIETDDFSYLMNPAVFSFFKNFLKEEMIQSFCLIYKFGNFLLLDEKGNKHYFIVRNKKHLKQLAEAAKKDHSSKEIIQNLAEGSVVPFFGEEKGFWDVPAKDWGKYLHPANPIPNENDFIYYSTRA